MIRRLALMWLLSTALAAVACETEPMKGYEGPCPIEGRMDRELRFFYTSPRKLRNAPTKKWDLQTGTVVEEGALEYTPVPPLGNAPVTVLPTPDGQANYVVQKWGSANDRTTRRFIREQAGASTTLKGWFTVNDGFYPVDGKTAWVFQHHDHDMASSAAFKSKDSRVAALYLVDVDSGERLRTIVFDRQEDPVEQRLREYIALKMAYSRERFTAQVARLQTPALFLLRPDGATLMDTIVPLDDRRLEMRSADRTLVYDIVERRPVRIGHVPGWSWTILSPYAPEKTYRITAGLGTSPEVTSPVGVKPSPVKGRHLLATLDADRVVVADNEGGGHFDDVEVWDTRAGARVHRLHGGTVRRWKLSDSGRYLMLQGEGRHHVYDTGSGESVFESDKPITLAGDGMLDAATGVYTPFATLKPTKLAWKTGRAYRYMRFQGPFILSFARGAGIEVFDIAANRYLTPMPLDTGLHDLDDAQAFRDFTMAYFAERQQLAVVRAGGATAFASRETHGKDASGYLLDLTTYAMEPILVNALPWEDPLQVLRKGSREQDRLEEARRREAAQARAHRLRLQEEALMAQIDAEVARYPVHQQLALFYPDGPLGAYVGDARKARALERHMAWWSEPERRGRAHGLERVPFAWVEDLLPHLSPPWASQARAVLPEIRHLQLREAKAVEQQVALERMKENLVQALRNYRAPPGAPSTLDRIHDYQRQHYLYGKASRDACSTANPCGPGSMFRTDGR